MSFSIINPTFGRTVKGNVLTDAFTYDTVYDISNNIYVCGSYRSNYVRPTIPTTNNTAVNNGFIAKYDTSYNLVWINIINSTGLSQVLSVIYLNNNIYFGGTYVSTATVTLSGGLTLPASSTSTWSFFCKSTTNGNILFANTISGVSTSLNNIYTESSNIYIVGGYQATASTVNLSGQTLPITAAGKTSSYFAVYNEGGTCTLARDISDMLTNTGTGYSISVNLSGIIVAGQEISGAGMNSYTKIFDPITGNQLASKKIIPSTYTSTNRIQILKCATTDNNIYIVGEYYGGTFTNSSLPATSNVTAFMIIYDNALNEIYSRRIVTVGSARYITIYGSDVYVAGYYNSGSTVDLSNGINIPASNLNDGLVIRYNLSGVTIGALPIRDNGTATTSSLYTVTRSATKLLIGGTYNNSSDLTLSGDVILKSNGYGALSDYFIEYDISMNIAYGTNSIHSLQNTGDFYNGIAEYNNMVFTCGLYTKFVSVSSDISDAIPTSRNNYRNPLITAYDASGNILWSKTFFALTEANLYNITANQDGIFVVGYYNSGSSIDIGNGLVIPASTGSLDALFIKYDFSGNAIWYSTIRDSGSSIFVNVNTLGTDIYVVGRYTANSSVTISGSAVVLPSTSNLESGLLIKYNSSGIAQWASTTTPTTNITVVYEAVSASPTTIIIGGRFKCTTTSNNLDLSNGITVPASYLNYDRGFVASYNTSGIAQWTRYIDCSSNSSVKSVGYTPTHIYIGGSYNTLTASLSGYLSPSIVFPPTNNATRGVFGKYDYSGNPIDGVIFNSGGTSVMYGMKVLEQNILFGFGYNSGGPFTLPRSSIVIPGSTSGSDPICVVYDLSLVPITYTRISEASNDGNFYGIASTYKAMYATGTYNSATPVDISNSIILPRTAGIDALVVRYGILTIPPTPINLTATPQIESILLNWSASDNATSYTVSYGISGSFSLTENFTTISGIILSLTPGTFYNFRVLATNALGTSFYSSTIYSTPLYPVPNTPTNFTAVGIINGIDLSWDAVPYATSYIVYYGTTLGTYDSSANFLASPGQLSTLPADTTYFLYIVSQNPSFTSVSGTVINATTLENPPDTPTIISAISIAEGAIIEWTDASRATGYMVAYGLSGTFDMAFTTPDLSGIFEDLTYNLPYNFKVRAYNSGGYSSYSSVVYVVPSAPVVGTPSIIEPTPIGRNEITITSFIPKNLVRLQIAYSEINGDFEFVIDSSTNVFNITYLKPATAYKFKIIAYGLDTIAYSDIIYKTTLSIPTTQTQTGNTTAGSVIGRNDADTIYNYKQTYDTLTGRVWQFRSQQERIAYLQGLYKNFTSK